MLPRRLDHETNRREFLRGLAYGVVTFMALENVLCLPQAEALSRPFAGEHKIGANWFGTGADGALNLVGTGRLLGASSDKLVVANYTTAAIDATSTLTTQFPSQALVVFCMSTFSNSGHVHMDGGGSNTASANDQQLRLYALSSGKRGALLDKLIQAVGGGGGGTKAGVTGASTAGSAGNTGTSGVTNEGGGGGGGGSGASGVAGFTSGGGGSGGSATAWMGGNGGGGGGGCNNATGQAGGNATSSAAGDGGDGKGTAGRNVAGGGGGAGNSIGAGGANFGTVTTAGANGAGNPAGTLVIICKSTFTNNTGGIISADGSLGGAGGGAGSTVSGGGSGGSAGGGNVLIFSGGTATNSGTIRANGGASVLAVSNTPRGGAGGAGGAGSVQGPTQIAAWRQPFTLHQMLARIRDYVEDLAA